VFAGAPNAWFAESITQDFSALQTGIAIPEPATALLMFGGLVGLLAVRQQK